MTSVHDEFTQLLHLLLALNDWVTSSTVDPQYSSCAWCPSVDIDDVARDLEALSEQCSETEWLAHLVYHVARWVEVARKLVDGLGGVDDVEVLIDHANAAEQPNPRALRPTTRLWSIHILYAKSHYRQCAHEVERLLLDERATEFAEGTRIATTVVEPLWDHEVVGRLSERGIERGIEIARFLPGHLRDELAAHLRHYLDG